MAKDATAIQSDNMYTNEGPKCIDPLESNGGRSTKEVGNGLSHDFQRKITFSRNEQLEKGSAAFLDTGISRGPLSGM